MGRWDHLIGPARFDPPVDLAFPPVSYGEAGVFSAALPQRVYPLLGGKQYQADAGSCTAHGYSVPAESWARTTGADFQVCRQDLYFGARFVEGNGAETRDGGAYPSMVRTWLRDYGTVDESRKPYAAHDVTTWRPPAAWAADRRLLAMTYVPLPLTASAILFEVGTTGVPVAICHTVTDSINHVTGDGVERFVDGTVLGGHCRAVVGYDLLDHVIGGEGCVLIKNSWHGFGVAHPLHGSNPFFVDEVDSFTWMPLSSLEDPRFLQSADRLAVPPKVLP